MVGAFAPPYYPIIFEMKRKETLGNIGASMDERSHYFYNINDNVFYLDRYNPLNEVSELRDSFHSIFDDEEYD